MLLLYTAVYLVIIVMASFSHAGTPEVAGLTPIQGMEIVRGCRGLNLIGADVVEVFILLLN